MAKVWSRPEDTDAADSLLGGETGVIGIDEGAPTAATLAAVVGAAVSACLAAEPTTDLIVFHNLDIATWSISEIQFSIKIQSIKI